MKPTDTSAPTEPSEPLPGLFRLDCTEQELNVLLLGVGELLRLVKPDECKALPPLALSILCMTLQGDISPDALAEVLRKINVSLPELKPSPRPSNAQL
jgi:hypothetical protein